MANARGERPEAEGDKIPLADVVFQKGGYQINVTLTDGLLWRKHSAN